MSQEMVDAVKQAMREIEEDKLHQEVHGRIRAKLLRKKPSEGEVAFAKCGMCEQILELRGFDEILPKQSS
jgi:hypothetical protein